MSLLFWEAKISRQLLEGFIMNDISINVMGRAKSQHKDQYNTKKESMSKSTREGFRA